MKKYFISKSGIHGKGIFLNKNVKKDETIFIFKGKEVQYTGGAWFYMPNALQIGYVKWIVPEIGMNTWIQKSKRNPLINQQIFPLTAH